MKRSILLFFLAIAFTMLNAQETYHFRTSQPQGVSVESSTASGLSLHYSIQELGIANIENGDVKGQEIILKGQFAPNAEGYPNLPVVNRYVAIPQGATVSLQVKENASAMLTGIDLLPAMPAQCDLDDKDVKLRWDASIFSKDANFPAENTVLSTPTQIRKLDVVILSVTPFRYNPVRKTLEVIYDIDIDIRFEGGNGQFGESRYLNPDWEHILRNLVINSEMIPTTDYYSLVKSAPERDEEGCEYLIISPDDPDILAWADTLKAFRTKQGILTKVVTVTECGGNYSNTIHNYLVNAYNNWAIPPAAVLMFGGAYGNVYLDPYFLWTIPETGQQSSHYPTDYLYCDMNNDFLADMAISRITARNLNEYRIFVEKTIQYESAPSTDAAFYDHPIITSGYEGNKWFMITSQSVDGFYRNKLGKHPTNLYFSYMGPPTDSIWSIGYNTEVLLDYFGSNGQNYIPQSMNELHDWRTSNDPEPLINALNEGSFLTMYRGHACHNFWYYPHLDSPRAMSLHNEHPTFVLSITCHTSCYNQYGPNDRCLVDALCINENGGAVGGIGATDLTHSYFNDILAWGIYDCIWPDFLPDMGGDTPPEFVRPSYVLTDAKLYFAYHYFLPNYWSDIESSTMCLFGYTGETYLNLFTEVPRPIRITHEPDCPEDASEYTVTAEEGAVVCLSKDGEIIGVVRSNGQPYTFTLPQLEEGEHFTLTATKQNRIRYEYEVPVVASSDPFDVIERSASFALYPNPTEGMVNLVMGQDLQGKSVVEVYNILGHRMTSKAFQNLTKGQNFAFDLQHYAPGLYIIKLCNDEGCWSQKVSVR